MPFSSGPGMLGFCQAMVGTGMRLPFLKPQPGESTDSSQGKKSPVPFATWRVTKDLDGPAEEGLSACQVPGHFPRWDRNACQKAASLPAVSSIKVFTGLQA